jgi:hypothetical protein
MLNLGSTGGDSGQFKYFVFSERISYPIVPLIPTSSILGSSGALASKVQGVTLDSSGELTWQFRNVTRGHDCGQFRCINKAI